METRGRALVIASCRPPFPRGEKGGSLRVGLLARGSKSSRRQRDVGTPFRLLTFPSAWTPSGTSRRRSPPTVAGPRRPFTGLPCYALAGTRSSYSVFRLACVPTPERRGKDYQVTRSGSAPASASARTRSIGQVPRAQAIAKQLRTAPRPSCWRGCHGGWSATMTAPTQGWSFGPPPPRRLSARTGSRRRRGPRSRRSLSVPGARYRLTGRRRTGFRPRRRPTAPRCANLPWLGSEVTETPGKV